MFKHNKTKDNVFEKKWGFFNKLIYTQQSKKEEKGHMEGTSYS